MKIAYISLADYPCPPPPDSIQAALWITSHIVEQMTKRGHETYFFGASGSTVKATNVFSMGKGFYDIYPYPQWSQFPETRRIELFQSHTHALLLYAMHMLEDMSVDIVHFHTSPPFLPLPFLHHMNASKVLTFHDPLYEEYQQIFTQYELVKNTTFVSISESQKRCIHFKTPCQTIYHGIRLQDYPMNTSAGSHLLFFGRANKRKGIEQAIAIAKRQNMPLHINGRSSSGEMDYFQQVVQPYIDGTSVIFQNVVTGDRKMQELSRATALLFPIQWEEPFGLVMIEAMACGTPVIAFNRGSVSEIIEDGVTGFIIDPDDEERPHKGSWMIKKQGIDGFIEALQRIDSIDRTACRGRVEKFFSEDRMIDSYERLYHQIISDSNR